MRRIIFCFIFSCCVFTSATAQNLNKYQYIQVPEKFDFLKEENQYKLNALTKFLFEKYGFQTLYKEEIPQGIDPCDVLQANVHSDSNLFRSKVYVTLKTCENKTVFTTQTGSSREKDFQASYHEALRDAFTSIENLNYTWTGNGNTTPGKTKAEMEAASEIIVDPIVTSEEIDEVTAEETSSEADQPTSKASKIRNFTNGPVTYLLEPTSSGYDLYRKGEQEKFASLMKSGGGENFLYSSKNVSGNAFFDSRGNLVVEYLEPNSQQMITVNYKLQSQ